MFREAATKLAENYLINEKTFDNFLAKVYYMLLFGNKIVVSKVAFFKDHPDVNEHLLEYSVTIATLARKDCAPYIPNPIEVILC